MTPFVGELKIFGGNYAPVGWMLCAGQLLAISQYEVLYALLGTTYGGDGVQTFGLPDLRGRVPVHTAPQSPPGTLAGSETVTLTSEQMPSHTHGASGSSNTQTTSTPTGNVLGATSGAFDVLYGPPSNTVPLQPQAVSTSGGSLPHDNVMPSLVVNWIIAYEGIYPSQS